MTWYAAHIVMSVRFKEPPQDRFPVWENIVLIEAETEEEAWEKAERRGREEEGDSGGSMTWGGRPAEWVLAGVRKLCQCVDPTERPGDGTEVSYVELELASASALAGFVEGRPVSVFVNDFEQEEQEETIERPAETG
jgi:hypothetical protein